MPRKPQTNEQKAAKGETRPSRQSQTVVEFPVVTDVPQPPTWLKLKAGKDLWNELAPLLHAQRVLTTVDLHALGHLCQLHAEIVSDVRKRIRPTAAERSQLRMYFSEFGLTPSSRTRIGPGGSSDAKQNPFSRNGKPAAPAD